MCVCVRLSACVGVGVFVCVVLGGCAPAARCASLDTDHRPARDVMLNTRYLKGVGARHNYLPSERDEVVTACSPS